MVRKLVSISLFVFWAVLVSILTAGLVFKQNNITGDVTGGGNNNSGNISGGGVILTASEVAKHSSANDCWLIINNKVYDVTNFLSIHPGGSGTIIPFCGQEATAAFDSKEKNPAVPHSQTADNLLNQYYIGDFNQAINQPGNQTQNPPPGNNTGTPGNGTGTPNNTITLTPVEVAKHNSVSNCWLIINGNVYDVTNFLNSHPGGANTIIPYCGQEATAAFDSKDRNPAQPHSQTADALLANYYIGMLGQAVPPQNVTQPPPANPPGNTGGRGERDDD